MMTSKISLNDRVEIQLYGSFTANSTHDSQLTTTVPLAVATATASARATAKLINQYQ